MAEGLTKEVRSREKGESEEGAKAEKSGWGVYSAEGVNLQERMEPEKWPWDRRVPQERMYSGVWVELAKGVWPAERGGPAERVQQREEGLVGRAWPKDL